MYNTNSDMKYNDLLLKSAGGLHTKSPRENRGFHQKPWLHPRNFRASHQGIGQFRGGLSGVRITIFS